MNDNTEIYFEVDGRFKTTYPYWDKRSYDFQKFGARRIYSNTEIYSPIYGEDYVDKITREDLKEELRRLPVLQVKMVYYPDKKKSRVYVEGSWRKWYLGAGSTRDLRQKDFKKCMMLIAENLGCDLALIENARITKIELGMNMRFSGESGMLVDGFVFFKGMKRLYRYDNESVCFENETTVVRFYDKLREIMKRVSQKPHLLRKLNKAVFILRFEIKLKMPRKAPNGLKNYLDSPIDIYNNWNEVILCLNDAFEQSEFVPYATPESLEYFEGLSKVEFDNFKSFMIAHNLGGIENYLKIVGSLDNRNARKYVRQERDKFNSASPKFSNWLEKCNSSIQDVNSAKEIALEKIRSKVA